MPTCEKTNLCAKYLSVELPDRHPHAFTSSGGFSLLRTQARA